MTRCNLCPRACNADRTVRPGYCGAGEQPVIARFMLHQWEEPCISGAGGAGAVFFCGCNLNCIFCQNYKINHHMEGIAYDSAALAALMLSLQGEGAHTIDLVTPTPHLDTIIPALESAKKQGLHIPIVYNTNAYETLDSLRRLDGLIDIYLPDFKYVTPSIAKAYSACEDYFTFAAPAIREMYRQTGLLQLDDSGIAQRGLLIRHLVLPGAVSESRRVLDYLAANYPKGLYLSLMGQYVPYHIACNVPPLNRKLLQREYDRALEYCFLLGFTNVYMQELSSADASFTPVFVKSVEEL